MVVIKVAMMLIFLLVLSIPGKTVPFLINSNPRSFRS